MDSKVWENLRVGRADCMNFESSKMILSIRTIRTNRKNWYRCKFEWDNVTLLIFAEIAFCRWNLDSKPYTKIERQLLCLQSHLLSESAGYDFISLLFLSIDVVVAAFFFCSQLVNQANQPVSNVDAAARCMWWRI